LFGLLLVVPAQADPVQYLDRIIEREGISMHLRIESVEQDPPPMPYMGQSVRIWLNGKRLTDDQPLSNWRVGVWLDRETDTLSGAVPVCSQRIARYLNGNLIQRPLLDLTGYYVLSLDAQPSVSVLDPSVNFSGRSSLYTSIELEGEGFDWAKTSDDARLYIAIPSEKKLAIADLQLLNIINHFPLLGQPTRLALQPDERLLWVGQTGKTPGESAVDVFDTVNDKAIVRIPLPYGHHEFAFSDDGRYAFVSSRQSKTVGIIDINTWKIVHALDLDFEPIGLVFDNDRALIWVIDGNDGRVYRYNTQGIPVDTIKLESGLGPAKLSPDGRYIFIVNPSQHWLHILNTSEGKERHRITISGQPYDVMFSEHYAYVRTLQSEQIGLLSLASLESAQPILKSLPAGASALSETSNILRASTMALTLDRAGAFFVTPAERTLHHYMEGMNAPSAGLRTYGHTPMAAMVMQRGLREIKPGQYSAVIRLPSAGQMVLSLASEVPVLRECLGLTIETSNKNVNTQMGMDFAVQWLSGKTQSVVANKDLNFRIKIKDTYNMKAVSSGDFRLRLISSRGGSVVIWPLRNDPAKPGEWFANGMLTQSGGYYVYVEGDYPLHSVYSTVVVKESNQSKTVP